MHQHEWDSPAASAELPEPWLPNVAADGPSWGPEWDADDGEAATRESAAREFLNELEFMYMSSKISAENFCLLTYFAG